MTDDLDFYDLLGVDRDASEADIRTAFRGQVREYHPDLNDDPRAPAQFTAIKKAYDTLADPEERKAYDRLGHDEYVRKRISGLPSPDQWQVPDRHGAESTDDASSGQSGTASATRTSRTSTASASGPATESTASASGPAADSTASASGPAADSTASAGGSGTSDQSTGWTVGETGESSGTGTATGSRSRTTASTETNAGVGSDPTASTTGRRSGTDRFGTKTTPEAGTGGPGGDVEFAGIAGTVRRWFHESSLGWPLIFLADLLYLAGVGTYAAANAEGVGQFLDALTAAGTDLGGSWQAITASRYGVEGLPAFLRAEVASAVPVGAALVLAGMAFLPSVYLFIIRETRQIRTPWQPTYLYVVAALGPILGLLATLVVDPPGVAVEVVCYAVLPVATIVGLPFSAFVRPWMMRRVRRVWWRVRG